MSKNISKFQIVYGESLHIFVWIKYKSFATLYANQHECAKTAVQKTWNGLHEVIYILDS